MFVSGAIKISTLKSLNKVRRAVVRIKLFYHNKGSRYDARSQCTRSHVDIRNSIDYIYINWAVESTVICLSELSCESFCRNCQVLIELLLLIIVDLCDKSKSSKSHDI